MNRTGFLLEILFCYLSEIFLGGEYPKSYTFWVEKSYFLH